LLAAIARFVVRLAPGSPTARPRKRADALVVLPMTDRPAEQARPWDRHDLNDELFRRPPVPMPARGLVVHTAFRQDADQAARSVARHGR